MNRLAIVLALTVLAAGPVAAAPANEPQAVLNARDMDIQVFIQQVARMTDMTFIVDPRVHGTVPAIAEAPASKEALFDLFVSTLRANGVAAVPSVGGAYRIFPADDQVERTSARNALMSDGTLRL